MMIERLTRPISNLVRKHTGSRAVLVGISGIDGSGKGWVTAKLKEALEELGVTNVTAVSADAWLAPPCIRFRTNDPPGNFYRHGLRLNEMYEQLVVPLKEQRRVDTGSALDHDSRAAYGEVSVILLEGIFIFKKEFQCLFDLAVWVDCSFTTALERALARRQEGPDPIRLVAAYEQIYFPAQRLHMLLDDPVSATDYTIRNDPRLPSTLKRTIHDEVLEA